MRILHLITWLTIGGIEHWLSEFINSTIERGPDMEVCCRKLDQGVLAGQLIQRGIKVHSCPMLPNLHTYDARLGKLIRDSKIDIVHNHLGATSMLAVRAAKRCGVPVITTFHSPQFAAQTPITRLPLIRQARALYTSKSIAYAVRYSDLVTGVSQGVLKSIVPGYEGDSRFRVTYLGIPPRQAEAKCDLDIRSSQSWSSETKLLIKLGRLAQEKDPLTCVDILSRVITQVPSVKLAFIGDGVLRDAIVQKAKQLGVENAIVLLGHRADAPALLRQANVLIHPSRYEGFGLAVAEAASIGIPAVASDIPGLDEAIVNKKTGFLHPPGDATSMAQSVTRLLTDEALYNTMSENARTFSNQHFGASRCQDGIRNLYQEVLRNSRKLI